MQVKLGIAGFKGEKVIVLSKNCKLKAWKKVHWTIKEKKITIKAIIKHITAVIIKQPTAKKPT